jgi:uncharacterized protein
MAIIEQIADGRTDLVFDHLAQGHPANSTDQHGTTLIRWCSYYGDVSAIRFLLAHGERLESLGDNFGLGAACFHGHWRLVQFLLEQGAQVNLASPQNGETPLHSALCTSDSPAHDRVVRILLANRAYPNAVTMKSAQTGAFMRDCRTKGETPLHRAAAFAGEETIQLLLDAGATLDAKDMNGDSPLCWASWYVRPTPILRKLLYSEYRIHPNHKSMAENLLGKPHV